MNFVEIRAYPIAVPSRPGFHYALASRHFGAEFRFFSNFHHQRSRAHTMDVHAHVIQLGA